ncbi:head protein [Natronospirillum operosum]|uniref:Head protein n=1 Tax=Natronospirillum operosum TaxID=2759953 RepID=A0A4Z0WCD0_9GAMM|nr:Mu-like prophage major head subunit gpT family protein [Natronospirillum operosum]TGG92525.1 head protein [Natronospirillum operosum]
MIITPDILTALMTTFRADFDEGTAMADPAWNKVATLVRSSSKSNTYGWLGQFPGFREWVGDRQVNDMAAHGYQITNKLWESTVGVQRTDIEDDELGIYSPLFREAGRASAVHPDELVFALIKSGHTELCYDGQNFFDDEHPVYPKVDGTGTPDLVSNQDIPATDPGTAWYLLDTSRALKPFIFQERTPHNFQALTDETDQNVFIRDEYLYGVRARSNVGFGFWQMAYKSQQPLNAANYAAARQAMSSQKADGGRPLAVKPTMLVVPPSLRSQADEVLKAERLANGATNTLANTAELLETPWIM